MPSPLEEINWNNLSSAEVTTAIRLLMLTTAERYVIGQMNQSGLYGTAIGDLFPRYVPAVNNPDWGLPNTPLGGMSPANIKDSLDGLATWYIDKAKFDLIDGQAANNSLFVNARLIANADDPVTYHNRMFELAGIPGTDGSQYPDLQHGSPVEVKKWYDLITQCKWVDGRARRQLDWLENFSQPDNDVDLEGEYDPNTGKSFTVDEEGCENYGLGTGESPTGDLTAWNAWRTAHDNLWGTFSTSYFRSELFDSSIPIPPRPEFRPEYIYFIHARRNSGVYKVQTQAMRSRVIIDWSTHRNVIGSTGKPLNYAAVHQVFGQVSEFGSTGITWPGTHSIWKNFSIAFNEIDADTTEVICTPTFPKAIIPASLIPNNTFYKVWVTLPNAPSNAIQQWLIELWDGDGGFVFFTPP